MVRPACRHGLLGLQPTARAENRRFGRLSAPRAHPKASYKIGLVWENAKERLGRLTTPGGRGQTRRDLVEHHREPLAVLVDEAEYLVALPDLRVG